MSNKLSPPQLAHIHEHETCPDCQIGWLLEGPRALGINVNVKCNNLSCRHEFCIVLWHGTVVSGERLDRDEPAPLQEPSRNQKRIRAEKGKEMSDGLYRVETPHLCAGFVVKGGKVVACAPILRKRLDYWRTVAVRIR
jgi:hypothetical protein